MNIKDIGKKINVEKDNNKDEKNFSNILKGSIISIIITLVFLVIFSLVIANTNVKESTIIPGIIIISAMSLLIGSIISTLKVSKKGLLNGAHVWLIYIIILYIISSFVNQNFEINVKCLIMIVTSIIMGMIGGIIGINIKK